MPAQRAVSIRPVPLGTWTSMPSIVTVTSSGALIGALPDPFVCHAWARRRYARSGGRSAAAPGRVPKSDASSGHLDLRAHARVMLVDRRHEVIQRRFTAEGAPALVEMPLVLLAELRDVARNRHRGRVAERTQAVPEDPVADVEQ